ncbi:hypothetical protein SERLA73DRAFT_184465, partial [Serpula lacrymans var. lacrymans S7.3]
MLRLNLKFRALCSFCILSYFLYASMLQTENIMQHITLSSLSEFQVSGLTGSCRHRACWSASQYPLSHIDF